MLSLFLLIAAQNAAAAEPDLMQRLLDCRSVSADDLRLACYDRTVKAVDEAKTLKQIVVLNRVEVQQAKKSMFGFSLPSIKLFGDGKDDQQLKQLIGTLQSSTPLPGGLLRFSLDDGGVWETTEQTMVPFRRSDTVTIKAASLGSYIATATNRRAVRVRRLR